LAGVNKTSCLLVRPISMAYCQVPARSLIRHQAAGQDKLAFRTPLLVPGGTYRQAARLAAHLAAVVWDRKGQAHRRAAHKVDRTPSEPSAADSHPSHLGQKASLLAAPAGRSRPWNHHTHCPYQVDREARFLRSRAAPCCRTCPAAWTVDPCLLETPPDRCPGTRSMIAWSGSVLVPAHGWACRHRTRLMEARDQPLAACQCLASCCSVRADPSSWDCGPAEHCRKASAPAQAAQRRC
jgi:hypothetical protein